MGLSNVKATENVGTIQVSFRLPVQLVERMRDVSTRASWPPPPSQTDLVIQGLRIVLDELERELERRKRNRARAKV
jgi:hypothetical protein